MEWDIDQASEAISRIQAILNGGELVETGAMALVKSTMRTAPVQTGTLRRSIRINSANNREATYGPHVIYAAIQNNGGVIRIRTKKVLADRRTGQFFGLAVTIRGQHYMERGGDQGIEDARQSISQKLAGLSG